MKTYDVHFNDSENSNSNGFSISIAAAKSWIANNRGTGYFIDYAGGEVSIVCNETGETVYTESI
jgi:hypothetical protein